MWFFDGFEATQFQNVGFGLDHNDLSLDDSYDRTSIETLHLFYDPFRDASDQPWFNDPSDGYSSRDSEPVARLQTTSTADEGEEIVVVGYRIAPWAGGGSVGEFNPPRISRHPDDDPPAYETRTDQDVVTVSKHSSLGPLTTEQRALIQDLMNSYYQWVSYLQSIPADTVFYMPNGETSSASEVLSMFLQTDFVIYPAGFDHGNGGAGFADYNGGNPVLGINIDALGLNMATSDMTAWYFTHELAHMTNAGRAYYGAMDDVGSDGGVLITQGEWMANERFANSLGDALARASHFTFSPIWQASGAPGGYGGTVTYSTAS